MLTDTGQSYGGLMLRRLSIVPREGAGRGHSPRLAVFLKAKALFGFL